MKKKSWMIIGALSLVGLWIWIGFLSRAGVEQVLGDGIIQVVELQPLMVEIEGAGKVQDYKAQTIYSRIDGLVKEIYVEVKDHLQADQPILQLENVQKRNQLKDQEYQLKIDSRELELLKYQVSKLNLQKKEQLIQREDLLNTIQRLEEKYKLVQQIYELGDAAGQEVEDLLVEINNHQRDLEIITLSIANTEIDLAVQDERIALAELSNSKLQEELLRLQEELKNLTVVVERQGILKDLLVEEGQWVNSGSQLAFLSDPIYKVAEIWINEFDISYIKKGQSVLLRPEFDQSIEIWGEVNNIDENPQISNGLTRFKVEVIFVNTADLYSGLSIGALIEEEIREQTICLPIDALMEEEAGEQTVRYVFVEKNGKVERVTVQTGIIQHGDIEIIRGIHPGDRVVVGPYEYLEHLRRSGG